MQRTLFLIFSACILIFSIISLCTAPIINNVLTEASNWNTNNCKQKSDIYKNAKDNSGSDEYLKYLKKEKNLCNRQKAMYGLEYSSLILDVSLGFICAILGLLHFFDVGKSFQKYSGIIGLVTGIILFILTLVYVIYSGYIFTHDITKSYDSDLEFPDYSTSLTFNPQYASFSNNLIKLNGKGAFAEWDSGKNQYKCLFYKKDDYKAMLAKYNDLGKKQYNYEKKRNYPDNDSEYNSCKVGINSAYINCYDNGGSFNDPIPTYTYKGKQCEYLYLEEHATGIGNKYLYDMWVTTIIFSCFISACAIGLAIFGFLLFKNSDGSGI